MIRPGQGGASVWQADLDGRRYALRVSGPYLSALPDWIEFEGEMLSAARASGVSVAAAVRGVDGRFGQAIEGGVAFLTDWAEGNIEWPAPPEKANRLGRAVAQLHLATEDVAVHSGLRPFDTAGLLDRPMSLLAEVADPSPLASFVESMRERIDAIPVDARSFGPIHGDVHQGNCHYHGETATLFDFAQCGVGWRAFDLAGFLWPWRDESIEKPELRAACDAYVAGYQAVRLLLPEEQSALGAFIQARDLWEAGEWIATGDGRERPAEVKASIAAMEDLWSRRRSMVG